MAKSLRSKRRRKMRAIKRIRYGEKELKQLKSILVKAENKDIDMSDICTVLPKDTFKNLPQVPNKAEDKNEINLVETNNMDIDIPKRKYHSKKLTDENGHYPPWMNQRAIQKHKAKTSGIRKQRKTKKK